MQFKLKIIISFSCFIVLSQLVFASFCNNTSINTLAPAHFYLEEKIPSHLFSLFEYGMKSLITAIKEPDIKILNDLDIIVILGSPHYTYAALKAIDLYNQSKMNNKSPLIITTGGTITKEGISEGEVMAKYLMQHGISSDSILIEKESKTTGENIDFAYNKFNNAPQIKKKFQVNKDTLNVAIVQYSAMMLRHTKDITIWQNGDGKNSKWNITPIPSEIPEIAILPVSEQLSLLGRLGFELRIHSEDKVLNENLIRIKDIMLKIRNLSFDLNDGKISKESAIQSIYKDLNSIKTVFDAIPNKPINNISPLYHRIESLQQAGDTQVSS
ncbi:MAG: hypothetical protein ACD_79C00679G0005 [uncultured bacterium]|nr:MAG: hypothetical protein ACD_79C00679G0005 [uncultured bacterium]